MNILVIEDSLFYQKIFNHFFATQGLEHTIVSHGLHGLDEYDQNFFDLVFVDINLPDISGWEVIKSLQNEDSSIQVIPVTGYDTESAEALFKTISPGRFLIKPFNDEDLVDLMEIQTDEQIFGGFMDNSLEFQKEKETKEELRQFCDSLGFDVAKPLLDLFIKEVQTKVPNFKFLFEQGHFSEIENSVHQLKSNCRYFGFNDYAEVCDKIERQIVCGETKSIEHLLDHLTDQSDSLVDMANQVLTEMIHH